MIYKHLISDIKFLERKINEYQEQLVSLPEGQLVSAKDRSSTKWYVKNESYSGYLPKSEYEYAQKLAWRKYLLLKTQELTQEKKQLERCLKNFPKRNDENLTKSDQLFYDSRYKNLMASYCELQPIDLEEWTKEPYEHNPNFPDTLTQKSFSGNLVRSKSESLIDTGLYINHIPFRYECALLLNNITFYPDFTILHPVTHKLYYWEHFGMMDDPAYARKTFSKLQTYCANGIFPDVNLIMTFETQKNPISADHIDKIIKAWFLE